MTTAILEAGRKLQPELVNLRRTLHENPELSGKEFETTERLRSEITRLGLKILPLELETGLVALLEGGNGPTVALRADIDALPMAEKTGAEYASLNEGVMHACGHDLHMAVLVGAAQLLTQRRDELQGNVLFLFQPAEEAVGGARILLQAGAFRDPRLVAVFGLHNNPNLPVGQVGVKSGPLMASVDTFDIHVTGKGGHAATPHATVDSIVAASAIVGALQTIVSRTINPLEAAVVSVGSFHGGTTYNIIPDEVHLQGTVRTFMPAVRDTIEAKIHDIAERVASGYGATAAVDYQRHVPAVTNAPELADLVAQVATEVLGSGSVVEAAVTTASEDFALYQGEVPGCFFWLGAGNEARGITKGWHNPEFDVDEDALSVGAALMAALAQRALEQTQ